MLFGYVDFLQQKLVVEDEVWVHYKSTGQIADLLLDKMDEVWPDKPFKPHIFADAPLQQLIDFQVDHRIVVEPAMKHDKDATLSQLRTCILTNKVHINPRCERLIYQLENGVWNDQRTKWTRSDQLGHCDGIAALGYFVRSARWRRNPFPKGTYDPNNTFTEDNKQTPESVQVIREVFRR